MEWRTIDSAPKDGTRILIGDFKEASRGEHVQGVAAWAVAGRWSTPFAPDWYWQGSFQPTHWMPLPTPPEAL